MTTTITAGSIEAAATGHGHPALASLLRILADRADLDLALLQRVANDEHALNALYEGVVGPVADLLADLITLNYATDTPADTPDAPAGEVVWADDDGEFLLRDGSFGNPGCDECGTNDAVCRDPHGTYLCLSAARSRGYAPPGGWNEITVTETVRGWGRETASYTTHLSLEQIKTRIADETGEPASNGDVTAWLADRYIPTFSDFELKEITDRDWTQIEVQRLTPPAGER